MREEVENRGETGHVNTTPADTARLCLYYRLAFDNVVSDLLKVKPADTWERAGQKAETRPNKARKGSRRKG